MRIFLVFVLLLTGCNFQKMKGPQTGNGGETKIAGMPMSYSAIQGMIIGPKCVSCHDSKGETKGGVALDTYKNVRALLTRISVRSLDRKDMPPAAPLSPAEQTAIAQWIQIGAPEQGAGLRGKITPPVGVLNWKFISDNVLTTCTQCHSQPDPEAGLDLTEAQIFRDNVSKIFDRTIVKRACPLPPLPSLTEDEQNTLVKWISQGMPD